MPCTWLPYSHCWESSLPCTRFFGQVGKPDFEFGAAAVTILLMALICAVLLFFAIVSFINARRERKAASKLMHKAEG